MNHRHLKQVDLPVVVWGGLVVALSTLWDERSILLGAALGAGLSLLNWLALRYVGLRMAAAGGGGRFAIFMAMKGAGILAAVGLVLWLVPVHPVAFATGLSALVLGVLTYGFRKALAEGEAALSEER